MHCKIIIENMVIFCMERRNKILLILGVCIFALSIVGLTYAFWQVTLKQKDHNLVYSDCLKLTFEDENDILLQDAYPILEEEETNFFNSNIPYHFTITNQCESAADLSINLEVLPVEKGKNELDDKWLDIILFEGHDSIL